MRKKPRFTHGRGYFRGDVSGKRFSSHVMERNVDRNWRGPGVETTKGWKVQRESDGKRVGIQMCDWAGRSCGVGKQGKTRVRTREEPIVRWCRGMAHHCLAPHGHGIATQWCTWG